MAAFNFPNSPSVNDLHTENGVTFKWNGTIWNRFGPAYTDTTNLNVTGISTFAGITTVTAAGALFTKQLNVVGVTTFTGVVNVGNGDLKLGDANSITWGEGTDALAYHTGSAFTYQNNVGDATFSNSAASQNLIFKTRPSSGGAAERLRIGSAGQLGIAGANYGSSGQVLTSQGGSAAPQWATAAGGGKILQVVQEHKTDTWSEGSIAPGAKTGAALTKAITTTANNNKVLVTISLTTGWSDQNMRTGALLKRGGTEIALADSTGDNKTRLTVSGQVNSGHWMEPQAFTYLDSPGSAATHTYTVHLWNGGANDTLTAYLNRAGYETNHNYRSRATSSITLMEVSP